MSGQAPFPYEGPAGLLQPIHIGNAQNLLVRTILGRVRPDQRMRTRPVGGPV